MAVGVGVDAVDEEFARLIADRVNERFSIPTDRNLVAQAQDEQTIVINIPKRWEGRSERLLLLISALYLERGEGFEHLDQDP